MGCVYLITSPSGKQYVGQTTQVLAERWRFHVWDAVKRSGECRALAHAIRKYGPDAMRIEALHQTEDLDELNRLEAHEIETRGTLRPGGYNLRTGGGNSRPCAETRALLAKTTKATFADLALRQRMREANKATWSDPAKRKQQSKVLSEIHRARHPNIFGEGRVFSSLGEAACTIGVTRQSIEYRLYRACARWRWWHTIPNHNDPECDAVEECWALLEFARGNPDHPNVPGWARQNADPELVALDQEVKDMLAERRRLWQAQQHVAEAA